MAMEPAEKQKKRQIFQFALIGDSDIDRWPSHLLPHVTGTTTLVPPIVSGRSGATLDEVVHLVEQLLLDLSKTSQKDACKNSRQSIILVVCAGENDIGSGIPLFESERSFRLLLEAVLASPGGVISHLIFLGPKIEPWLKDDPDSRKRYIQMSRAFHRQCANAASSSNNSDTCRAIRISYIDCLTMFCDDASADQPGALFGGKAAADPKFFSSDQLHLSEKGYVIWKREVENAATKEQES